MPADTHTRPGALVEAGGPSAADGGARRRVKALAERAGAALAGEGPTEQPTPAQEQAAVEREVAQGLDRDRTVERFTGFGAVPRLKARAETLAVDASGLTAVLDQLAEAQREVDACQPVSPERLLEVGAAWQRWVTARGIEEPDQAGAA